MSDSPVDEGEFKDAVGVSEGGGDTEPNDVSDDLDHELHQLQLVQKEVRAQKQNSSPVPATPSPARGPNEAPLSGYAQAVYDELPSSHAFAMSKLLSPTRKADEIESQLTAVMKNLYSKEVDTFQDRFAEAKFTLAVIEADREALMDELDLANRDRKTLLAELGNLAETKGQLAEALTLKEKLAHDVALLSKQVLDAKMALAKSREKEDDRAEELRVHQHEYELLRSELKDREEELFQMKVTLSESMKLREADKAEKDKLRSDKALLQNQKLAVEEELAKTKKYLEQVLSKPKA